MVRKVRRRARRAPSLWRMSKLVTELYYLTHGRGRAWEEAMACINALGSDARWARWKETYAPRPRRSDEAWLRQQLATLDEGRN